MKSHHQSLETHQKNYQCPPKNNQTIDEENNLEAPSRYDSTIVSNKLCNLTISLENNSATSNALDIFFQGMKQSIFENMSTMKKIESLPL